VVATATVATRRSVSQKMGLFITVNGELNKVYLCQKIISECCELVKLYHSSCSSFRHTVVTSKVLAHNYEVKTNVVPKELVLEASATWVDAIHSQLNST